MTHIQTVQTVLGEDDLVDLLHTVYSTGVPGAKSIYRVVATGSFHFEEGETTYAGVKATTTLVAEAVTREHASKIRKLHEEMIK